MIFSLEALAARQGDALLLHYGKPTSPGLIVIDGGPNGVYPTMKKRLEEIRRNHVTAKRLAADARLPIAMVMVSHIDDDHINGILKMTRDLVELHDDRRDLPYDIDTLWHNSFDDILGNEADLLSASVAKTASAASTGSVSGVKAKMTQHGGAVAASVKQGRDLRNDANKLGLRSNHPFTDLVMTGVGNDTVKIGGGLTFRIIGPGKERVDALRTEWDEQLKRLKLGKTAESEARAAEFIDESVFNLSSIVVLASVGKKRMLLTGDGRGDDILTGLEKAKQMKKGKIHLDILKVPHHGSDRNVSTDFFRFVTADHYIISGDGMHKNPELSMLAMLAEARGDEAYTVHLTYKESRVTDFYKRNKSVGKNCKVNYRTDPAASISVHLGEAPGY